MQTEVPCIADLQSQLMQAAVRSAEGQSVASGLAQKGKAWAWEGTLTWWYTDPKTEPQNADGRNTCAT